MKRKKNVGNVLSTLPGGRLYHLFQCTSRRMMTGKTPLAMFGAGFLHQCVVWICVAGFCLALSLASSIPVLATEVTETTEAQETSVEAIADGWHGSQYYRNGKALTGRRIIQGKVYYFDKKGYVVTGWKRIDGKVYYFSKKKGAGIKGAACTGKKKISSRYYYFNSKGVLKTGWKKINGKRYYFRTGGKLGTTLGAAYAGEIRKIDQKYYYFTSSGAQLTKTKTIHNVTYYIDDGACLEAYKKNSVYYKPNGKEMSSLESTEYETLLRAREIVAEITTSDMTKEQKLKVCYDWVISKPYRTYRKFSPTADWVTTYANDHFVRDGGDCHADGSAFAYLAKAIGYTEVYVCLDSNGITAQGHCWTEINGLVYDPLFSEAKDYYKYYGGSYSACARRAILHIKIS